jgi:hypothetical protein
VFADMAAFRAMKLSESGVDRPGYISTDFGSPNLFPVLGVRARVCRLFTPDEERRDADRVAVITDGYFESRFHRDAKVIGMSIALGGVAYTVIGVLPPKFHLPATSEGFDQLKPEVWDRALAIPGVSSASVIDNLPLHSISASNFYIAGRPGAAPNFAPHRRHSACEPQLLPRNRTAPHIRALLYRRRPGSQ